ELRALTLTLASITKSTRLSDTAAFSNRRPFPGAAVSHDGRGAEVLRSGLGLARVRTRSAGLEGALPAPVSRGVDRLRAARHDPAVVLVPGRRRARVLDRQPAGPGTVHGLAHGT